MLMAIGKRAGEVGVGVDAIRFPERERFRVSPA
jgi:hypothetical protein